MSNEKKIKVKVRKQRTPEMKKAVEKLRSHSVSPWDSVSGGLRSGS